MNQAPSASWIRTLRAEPETASMTHTLKAALRLPSQTLEHPLVLLGSRDQHLGLLQKDSIGHSWQSQGPLGMGLDSHGRVWDPKGGTSTPPK